MSSEIVLLSLSEWTKSRITAITKAVTQSDIDNALNDFFSEDAIIIVNGCHISRADFKEQIQIENLEETKATVTFIGTVEVPTDPKNRVQAGSVGVFYTANIQEALRVEGLAESRKVTASVNVVIEQDPDIPVPPPSPIRGLSDRRRVKKFNQVFTNVQVPSTQI